MRRRRVSGSLQLLIVLLLASFASSCALRSQRYRDFTTPTPIPDGDYLIIGFMGGRDSWRNERVGMGRMAGRLRALQRPGVHVVTVENSKRRLALRLVRAAADRDRDGVLHPEERRAMRVVLFGQSFGGAAVVKFARQLQQIDIPVLLTVQVDSVGLNDDVIPSNVRTAANLYQRDGLIIRGPQLIRAEDPEKTRIIGNYRYTYRDKNMSLSGLPFYKTIFRRDHTRMDRDPEVWTKVEELVLGALGDGSRISSSVQLPSGTQ
jgi:hypothetical protein